MTDVEHATYINSNNQAVHFGVDGLYMNEIALSWNYTTNTVNGKIISFISGIKTFSLPALIIAEDASSANTTRDKLHDVFMYDIVKNKKGRLIYRGYTLYCNITESKNSNYQEWIAFGDIELTVTTDDACWRKEYAITFITNAETNSHDSGYDYPYDYAYDYNCTHSKQSFQNNSFIESNFIMKIQGTVISPKVYINNHLYSVDVTLEAGNILEINSIDNTIILTKSNGEIENCFDLRNRSSHIFKKIAAGTNTLVSNQKLSVMLTYFDERGEPRWS